MTQLLTVHADFDRDLIWYRGHSVRYLLIQLLAEAATITERPPLNLALVIDSSGSMDGAPLEAAQLRWYWWRSAWCVGYRVWPANS